MPSFSTPAIVLRSFPHKESDLIVRFFSAEFGRLVGVARGARRARSAFTGRLEILHCVEVRGYRGPGREFASIDAVAPIETLPKFRSTLEGFYQIHYIAELLDLAFDVEEPAAGFFELVQGILLFLEHSVVSVPIGLRYLELQILQQLGHGLDFDSCVECHAKRAEFAGFLPQEGGFVCKRCLSKWPQSFQVTAELVEAFEKLSLSSLRQLPELNVVSAYKTPLKQLCQKMLLHWLEKPIRSARYLEELEQEL